jgi:hypothetical protein
MSKDSMDRQVLIDIKKAEFSVLQSVYWSNGEPRIAIFKLNRQWIADVERNLEQSEPQRA